MKNCLFFLIFWVFCGFSGEKILNCRVSGDTCMFSSQTVEQNENVTISVDPPSMIDGGILKIRFASCSIYAPPPEIFKKFRNVGELHMYQQKIQEIGPNTFLEATKLEWLDLYGNNLGRLYGHEFEGAINLIYLFLYESNIKEINVNAFEGLPNLETLWLYKNQIQYLHADTFRANPRLKEIRLNDNNLIFLNYEMFSGMNSLTSLTLSGNLCINSNFVHDSKYRIEKELKFCDLPALLKDFEKFLNPHGEDSQTRASLSRSLIFITLMVRMFL